MRKKNFFSLKEIVEALKMWGSPNLAFSLIRPWLRPDIYAIAYLYVFTLLTYWLCAGVTCKKFRLSDCKWCQWSTDIINKGWHSLKMWVQVHTYICVCLHIDTRPACVMNVEHVQKYRVSHRSDKAILNINYYEIWAHSGLKPAQFKK